MTIFQWIGKEFTLLEHDLISGEDKVILAVDKIAISITQELKAALNSGILQGIEGGIKQIPGLEKVSAVIDVLNKAIPKALAFELGIEALVEKPEGDQIYAFEQAVASAFSKLDPHSTSKVISNIAVAIAKEVDTEINNKVPQTFGFYLTAIEAGYQAYLSQNS